MTKQEQTKKLADALYNLREERDAAIDAAVAKLKAEFDAKFDAAYKQHGMTRDEFTREFKRMMR